MRKQSNEQPHVIQAVRTTTVIPPRASARPGNSVKARSHFPRPAYDLADVDTVPPSVHADISALDTVEQECYEREAGKHVSSTYTQYMDGTKKVAEPLKRYESWRNPFFWNPMERARWWLLYPGRIEFLLWSGGTLFLLFVTVMLILVIMISLRVFN